MTRMAEPLEPSPKNPHRGGARRVVPISERTAEPASGCIRGPFGPVPVTRSPGGSNPAGVTCPATVKASLFVGDNCPTPKPGTDHSHCLTALKLDPVLVFFRILQHLPSALAHPPHLAHGSFREVALMATITAKGRGEEVNSHTIRSKFTASCRTQ